MLMTKRHLGFFAHFQNSKGLLLLASIHLSPEEYQPRPPEDSDSYGIGIVGCGGIVQNTHLPAYRAFGYNVVGACDISQQALDRVKDKFGISFVTTQIDALLERDDVHIIDLAVHASQRRPLVEKIVKAGKPILSQKPFALTVEDAQYMVDLCAEAGVPLMINQQARWAPSHRAVKLLIERGVVGHVYSVAHINRSFQDNPNSWVVALKNFNIIDHGIHYIDLSRFFSGRTPIRVKATTTMVPGQAAITPMIYTILCEYEPEAQLMSTLHFNNIVKASPLHSYEWLIDGTEGSIRATQREITVSRADEPHRRHVFHVQGNWFPDAFGGSMGEMMRALSENREAETSGRDNLNSIKIAEAAVKSSETGEAVPI